MGLDLSALEDDIQPQAANDGKPPRAPLDRFYEDPEQPRKEVDPEADDRDRESIRQKGVLQAITVAPPDPDGRMRIIFGARRHRLAREAGQIDVPYAIQDDFHVFDDYAQVAENERRLGLSPLDLAMFIAKRKAKGDKQNFIAKNIGISTSDVTYHLTLVEGPHFVRDLYISKKCRTPKYLTELANLAKDHPVEVELFCAESDDFSRKAINELTDRLKIRNTNLSDDKTRLNLDNPAASGGGGAASGGGSETPPTEPANPDAAQVPFHNPDNEKDKGKPPALPDPSKIKKPLLLGTYKDDDVMILLYKRPTTAGLVHIKYENGNGEEEVDFGKIKNLTLTESTV